MRFRTVCSVFLSGVLLAPAPAWSQQASGPKANLVQPQAGGLKVVVLRGEGAMNNVKARTATQPAVEVRDEQDKPVAGAEVVFQLPAAGPGGVFNGWMRTQTARTDAQGQAAASGLTPNDEQGRFNIKVTATEGKRTGSVVIAQSNTANGGAANGNHAKHSHKTLWIVLAVAAAGGIAAAVAASGGDSSSSSTAAVTNPISITPGPVTVGGPK